uniref:Uncharacterized protein n=1 Tax=Arundo donax TaxID=35708 RepID=A0A0A9C0T7_ARUDO
MFQDLWRCRNQQLTHIPQTDKLHKKRRFCDDLPDISNYAYQGL